MVNKDIVVASGERTKKSAYNTALSIVGELSETGHSQKMSTKNKSAKPATKPAAKVATVKYTFVDFLFALIVGNRGAVLRAIARYKGSDGLTYIRATQDNRGLALPTSSKYASLCQVSPDGVIKGIREALIGLGCYVNGRVSGAKVAKYLTLAQWVKLSAPCNVHWNADSTSIPGRYVGNPHEKGTCAVSVQYGKTTFAWQMELDSNSNNKHERGRLEATKPGAKLASVTY